MDHLPTDDEQRFLVRSLYELIEERGAGPFVSAPILEPTSTFFPDRWEPGARGVRTLLRRLLAYAGLDDLDVEVQVFEQPDRQSALDAVGRHHGVAGWFAGIEDGVCRFGVDARKLGDAEGLVGVLCHEVAHAYRAHHGLMGDVAGARDRDLEEQLTDLTTIYLGFGILTVNNTDRHRAFGAGGYRTVTQQNAGYLSPQAMSFLLAAQIVARRLGALERRRLEGLLEPNQAAFVDAACEKLGTDPDKLARRLGLPPPAEWPKPRPIAEIVRALPDDHAPDAGDEAHARRAQRVKRRSRAIYVIGGVAGGVLLTASTAPALGPGPLPLVVFFGALVAGIALGRWARRDRCSACLGALSDRDVAACPACGAEIVETVDADGRRIDVPPPPPPAAAPELEPEHELSELEAHIVRLRAEPAIARARSDEMKLHRLLRQRRTRAKSPAEEAAIDWILRDPRPLLDGRARRPWLGTRLWTGTTLRDPRLHDPEDHSYVADLWLELCGIPIVPLAAYVVRPRVRGGDPEFLGRVPLPSFFRLWRGLFVLLALAPLGWAVPAFLESRTGKVHVINGLDIPVRVSIGGDRFVLRSGSRDVRVLPRGRCRAVVTSEDGRAIDEQDLTVPGGDRFLAYNVLGAAALFAREVVYARAGDGTAPPTGERYLGRKVVERDAVAFAFVEPPSSMPANGGRRFWSVGLIPGGWRASMRALAAEGSSDGAADLSAAVSLAEPFDDEAVARAIEAALALGGPDRALAHLARLIERAPESVTAHLGRQHVLRRAGRLAEARATYRRLHAEQPGSALAAYLRARVEPSAERLRLLPDLVRAHPTSALLRGLHGRTLLHAGRPAEALPELEQAAALSPRDREHWAEPHARALVAVGRVADAAALVASVATERVDMPLAVLYGRLARMEAARPAQPADHFFARAVPEQSRADFQVMYRLRTGEIDAARAALPETTIAEVRQTAEIELTALTDLAQAARLAAEAPPEVGRILDDAVAVLLAAELARAGRSEAAVRLVGMLHHVEDPGLLAERILGRPSDLDAGDLPLDVQAALRFVEARRRGVAAAELEAARREASALDVLRGPVTRVIAASGP